MMPLGGVGSKPSLTSGGVRVFWMAFQASLAGGYRSGSMSEAPSGVPCVSSTLGAAPDGEASLGTWVSRGGGPLIPLAHLKGCPLGGRGCALGKQPW